MGRNFRIILFWGAAWGFLEEALGYIFHSIALNIGWFFWFPLGYFFMNKVYKQTGGSTQARFAIFYTSLIAAALKLSNLLFHTRIDMALNPAVSIILEGVAVFFAFKILERKERYFKLSYFHAFALSVFWRFLYIVYLFLLPPYLAGRQPFSGVVFFINFILLESVANSIVIYFYGKFFDKKYDEVKANSIIFDPFYSVAMLVTAVFLQIGC